MADDRWNIKGRDESVLKRFREVKREYNQQRDETVTDEKALELLVEGVPVEEAPDLQPVLDAIKDLAEKIEALEGTRGTHAEGPGVSHTQLDTEQVDELVRLTSDAAAEKVEERLR